MLEVVPIPDLLWHGDHSALLRHCPNMLREWGPRLPRCFDDVPFFGPELERCAMAVDLALPARTVSGPAKLLVPWINHHGLFTVSELRRIDPGRRELHSTEGPRLFSCFLDFVAERSDPGISCAADCVSLEGELKAQSWTCRFARQKVSPRCNLRSRLPCPFGGLASASAPPSS